MCRKRIADFRQISFYLLNHLWKQTYLTPFLRLYDFCQLGDGTMVDKNVLTNMTGPLSANIKVSYIVSFLNIFLNRNTFVQKLEAILLGLCIQLRRPVKQYGKFNCKIIKVDWACNNTKLYFIVGCLGRQQWCKFSSEFFCDILWYFSLFCSRSKYYLICYLCLLVKIKIGRLVEEWW